MILTLSRQNQRYDPAEGCNAHLSKQGFDLGIDQFIVKNPIQLDIGNRLMATTMEAIIGAVNLNCNGQIPLCAGAMAALGISWPQ